MSNCVGWASTSYRSRYLGQAWPLGIWSLRKGDESLVTAEVGRQLVVRYWAPEDNEPGVFAIGNDGTPVRIVRDLNGKLGPISVVQALAAHNHAVPSKLAGAVDWLRTMVAREQVKRAA